MSLTEHQRAMRRTGITASDVRAIVGEDPYGRTPHDVYAAKVLGVDDFRDTQATRLGSACEPHILAELADARRLVMLPREPNAMTVRHPRFSHHIATPDAFFAPAPSNDCEALGEVKLVGLQVAGEWGDTETEVPDWVLVQTTWQAHCTGVPVIHVGAMIGTEVRTYTVRIDPDLEGALVDAVDRFHRDHIVAQRPPPADGSEGARRMLRAQWPRHRAESVAAWPEANDVARAYFEASAAVEEAESRKELARQRMMELARDAEGIKGDGWRLLYKWREPTTIPATTRAGYRHFDLRPIKSKGAKSA